MTARHPEVPNLMTAGMSAAPENQKSRYGNSIADWRLPIADLTTIFDGMRRSA